MALEREELRQLRTLTPPAADATRSTQMLGGLQAGDRHRRQLVAAATRGDAAAVSRRRRHAPSQLAATTRLAKPFGLDVCAR